MVRDCGNGGGEGIWLFFVIFFYSMVLLIGINTNAKIKFKIKVRIKVRINLALIIIINLISRMQKIDLILIIAAILNSILSLYLITTTPLTLINRARFLHFLI